MFSAKLTDYWQINGLKLQQVPSIQGIDFITDLEVMTELYQKVICLHSVACNALKIYNGMEFASDKEHNSLEKTQEKLEKFTFGWVNETCERCIFNNVRNQREGKWIEA